MRICITVKTYPHPSFSHQELVCTAGIREDGSFIRLYPIPFRYLPLYRQFKKYQWITVEAKRRPSDKRPESYQPDLETIQIEGDVIPAGGDWAERRQIVLARPPQTMCGLRRAYDQNHTSLGIIKPKQVTDLAVTRDDADWDPKHEKALAQFSLFEHKKVLVKVPYNFSYRFICEEQGCRGHDMTITDWELGTLYLDEVQRLGNEAKAVESVKNKFFHELCGADKDTHFFVGTIHPYNTWIVLGVFWPKHVIQPKPAIQTTFDLF